MGVFRKADDIEQIARILHLDQTMQRQGHLLGGLEAAVQAHGTALIQHQNRRTLVQVLRTEYLKIVWLHTYRGPLAIAPHRIHDAVLQVEVEGIAVLVELGIVSGLNTHAPAVSTVPTVAPHLQAVEDIVERFLADFAHPFGGQFQAVTFALQIASRLQAALQIPQFLEFLTSFWPQNLLQRLSIDVLERPLAPDVRQLLLELIGLLEFVHQVHGLL